MEITKFFIEKMENILSRLSNYMKINDLNNNKITVQAGLSNGLLGNAFKSGKGLNSESIEKILNTYPELSAEWLLTGRGDILRNAEPDKKEDDGYKEKYHEIIEKYAALQEKYTLLLENMQKRATNIEAIMAMS